MSTYLTVNDLELLPSPLSQLPSTEEEIEEIAVQKSAKPEKPDCSESEFRTFGKKSQRINVVNVNLTNSSLNHNASKTPFDNFEQEAYYITGYNDHDLYYTDYPQHMHHCHELDTSSIASSSSSNLQASAYDDVAFHYLSQKLTNTTFVHYSSCDQLSLHELNVNDQDINLETVSYPFEPEDYSVSQLLIRLADVEEEVFLSQHGYKKEEVLCDTQQGQLLKCRYDLEQKRQFFGLKNCSKHSDVNSGYVAIKKTDKQLFNQRISKMDGFNICTEEDIKKEAKILKYLTIDNKSTEYIVKYVDFFESDTDYYLVMEYIEDQVNLKQFVQKAHQYIKDKKLDLKHYQKNIKYLFWQISAVLHWLHFDMHCCHLDLNLENVVVKNGNFIENEDGSISIDNAISAKLCDFGVAELFLPNDDDDNKAFECVKTGSVLGEIQYQCLKMIEENVYDARKADNYALGMMLFEAVFGQPVFNKIDETPGSGYWSILNGKVNQFILLNNWTELVNGKLLTLINGLLCNDEVKRFNTFEILQCRWFKSYFKRYQQKLEKKSMSQKKKIKQQKKSMKHFKFYQYHKESISV